MSYSRSKTTTENSKAAKTEEVVNSVQEAVEDSVPVVEAVSVVEEAPKKKVFNSKDYVKCRSITSGLLVMDGQRTKDTYRWLCYGDTIEVNYEDLMAAVRSRSNYLFKPFFIVEDKDFMEQNPALQNVYRDMYTPKDIESIFSLDIRQMLDAFKEMPEAMRETILDTAATLIQRGTLDSVKKIREIDKFFGCQLMLQTGLTN